MIPTCMLFFNVGFTFISFTFANEYEDEEKSKFFSIIYRFNILCARIEFQ